MFTPLGFKDVVVRKVEQLDSISFTLKLNQTSRDFASEKVDFSE